jgi:hypothetical protein
MFKSKIKHEPSYKQPEEKSRTERRFYADIRTRNTEHKDTY